MSSSLDLKSKEEKDAELDKRIEALRRKNQALIKRYQEIEEDRKKAEQEGIAVTGGRRPRSVEGDTLEKRHAGLDSPTLTVQVSRSPEEKRVVSTERRHGPPAKASRGGSGARGPIRGGPHISPCSSRGEGLPEQPSWEETGPEGPGGSKRGRGGRGRRPRVRGGPAGDAGPDRRSKEWEERRRQNIEKMNEEMEKIAEYERSQRDGLQEKNPVRNFLDDPRRSGSFAESDRREGSRRHVRNWGGPDFDKVTTGMEQGKGWGSPARGGARRRGGGGGGGAGGAGPATLDMTLSMTGRERAEYIRWKQEREQIDRERLARHRQPTGEWRREWDAEKVDAGFKEGSKQGSSATGKQESKRPPKPPTFGEYLSEQPADRRKKGRSRGRPRSGPSKPYSMHDNRWEKEGQETVPPPAEDPSATNPLEQAEPPASPSVTLEEEEEDQWEDVSGGEEEEEEEEEDEEEEVEEQGERDHEAKNRASQDPKEEEEEPRSAGSPLPPRSNGHLTLAMPPPCQSETSATEGKPLTPFSPADGYQPVSDWGEEMDLSSPRADVAKSPLAGLGDASPSRTETASPTASRGAKEEGEAPAAEVPQAQGTSEPEVAKPEAGQATEVPGQQGSETEASPAPVPRRAEVADFPQPDQEQMEA